MDETVLAQRHVRQRRVILDHRDDHVAVPGVVLDRAGKLGAAADQVVALGGCAVVDHHIVAAAKNAVRHGETHFAETDKADFHDCLRLVREEGRRAPAVIVIGNPAQPCMATTRQASAQNTQYSAPPMCQSHLRVTL